MKKLYGFVLAIGVMVCMLAGAVAAEGEVDVLALWDFTSSTALTSGLMTDSTMGAIGGVSATISSGTLSTRYYPSSGADKSAGLQFNVSTAGYENIVIQWDTRHADGASRYYRVQYLDAGSWVDWSPRFDSYNNTDWVYSVQADLSDIAAVDDLSSFAFRLVTECASGSTYEATLAGYTYSETQRIYYDNVTVSGTEIPPVPEPAGLLALVAGFGGIAGMVIRRRN